MGRCAFATKKEKGWLCGTGCLRVTIDPDKANPKFVFYQLQKAETIGWVEKHAVGATMLNLNTSILNEVPVEIPDIETQNRIVDALSAYDSLIENNQNQIKLLEEAAQRLYKEWFIDLRFPGHEDTPIVDGVPKGWRKSILLDNVSILKRGISPNYSETGKYRVISQKCIRQSIMDISEARMQTKDFPSDLNLADTDTVICSTGIGTLGRVGQVFGEYPKTTFDSHVTLVRPLHCPNYFYLAIKAQQEYFMGMGRGSTNQQELYRNVIENVQVLLPSPNILKTFDNTVSKIHRTITALNKQALLLCEARDRLLPKLMSGEVEKCL